MVERKKEVTQRKRVRRREGVRVRVLVLVGEDMVGFVVRRGYDFLGRTVSLFHSLFLSLCRHGVS